MKSRLGVLGAAALAVPLLAFPGPPAQAATPDCSGAPLIEGTPGGTVTGTEGPDRIQTNGAAVVDALGGDDCVSVTSGGVDLGATTLRISLGDGDDSLYHDHLAAVDEPARGSLDGGSGRDEITAVSDQNLSVNLHRASMTTTSGLVDFDLTAFEDAGVDAEAVRLTGTNGSNDLAAHGCRVEIDAMGGNDSALVQGSDPFTDTVGRSCPSGIITRVSAGDGDDVLGGEDAVGAVLKGGPGRDRYEAWPESGGPFDASVRVDLAADVATFDWGGIRHRMLLRSVEDATITALFAKVTLVGDGRRNALSGAGCQVTLDGAGGADHLDLEQAQGFRSCRRKSLAAYGGAGDDALHGTDRADRLYGGSGRDVAKGLKGVDMCRAEVQRACER